jgi:hypothetical protein
MILYTNMTNDSEYHEYQRLDSALFVAFVIISVIRSIGFSFWERSAGDAHL